MARIYLTGFSCFGTIASNPTEELIQELIKHVQQQQQEADSPQARIIGTKCLEAPILVVHLGVDEKSSNIKLESRASNEAKFRIPDQTGWQPDGVAIDGQEDCRFVRRTKLPVRKLAGSLSNYGVVVSQDAGRYVCNYCYFISLEEAAKRKHMFSLFVHVPPFSKVSKDVQLECMHDLCEQLARCLLEGWEDGEEEEEVGQKGETEEMNKEAREEGKKKIFRHIM
ncbi:hypothetical protein Ndes2437A_g04229 [Nannochloris sp. 'desiccata']